jgi:hypothetical protein
MQLPIIKPFWFPFFFVLGWLINLRESCPENVFSKGYNRHVKPHIIVGVSTEQNCLLFYSSNDEYSHKKELPLVVIALGEFDAEGLSSVDGAEAIPWWPPF